MEMVGLAGLEPATSRLSVVCSSQLSYKPIIGLAFLCLAALASSRHTQRTVGYASCTAPRLPGQTQKYETEPSRCQTLVAISANHAFQIAKSKKPGDTWSLKTE